MTNDTRRAPCWTCAARSVPYPMLRTNRELDDVRPGVPELRVWTDHPPALSTIPPEAMKRGYGCENQRTASPAEWEIHIFKRRGSCSEGASSARIQPIGRRHARLHGRNGMRGTR